MDWWLIPKAPHMAVISANDAFLDTRSADISVSGQRSPSYTGGQTGDRLFWKTKKPLTSVDQTGAERKPHRR